MHMSPPCIGTGGLNKIITSSWCRIYVPEVWFCSAPPHIMQLGLPVILAGTSLPSYCTCLSPETNNAMHSTALGVADKF